MMPKGMTRSHLRNRLLMMRTYRGLTQSELAELLHVHKNQVARWESDINRPTPAMVDRLIEVLSCRRSDLFPLD